MPIGVFLYLFQFLLIPPFFFFACRMIWHSTIFNLFNAAIAGFSLIWVVLHVYFSINTSPFFDCSQVQKRKLRLANNKVLEEESLPRIIINVIWVAGTWV